MIFFWIMIFFLGLAVGSFFANWIERLARGKSVWRGLSTCPHCGRGLRAQELVPLFSFLFLKGRCRGCGEKISRFYFFTELVFGLYFVLLFYFFAGNWEPQLISGAVAGCFLLAIALADARHGRIFDEFTLGLFMCVAAEQIISRDSAMMIGRTWGLLFAGGFFGLQWLLSNGKALGEGDIKLGALIGFWQIKQAFFSISFAYVFGGAVAAILLFMKKTGWHSRLPLGTFLALSAGAVYFYEKIVNL